MAEHGQVGEAFVRVRANTTGLRSEVEGGVRDAFRGVNKIMRTAIGIGAGVEVVRQIKDLVNAGAEEETRAKLLAKAIDNAGASHRAFGKDIEGLIDKETRLKGFTDQELSSALARLVSATKNTTSAWKDLGLAEDVSRIRKIGLGQAAIAISKAEQGSATALRRLGIIVPPVNAAYASLKKRYDEAVASGAKFTKAQQLTIKQHLDAAKAADKDATRLASISEIQKRFGGSALTFANTAQGRFARLQVAMNEFRESIGKALLPPLASAASSIAEFIDRLEKSQRVQDAVRSVVGSLGEAFGTFASIARSVGPTILTIVDALSRLASAIGTGPLLAAAATFKAIQFSSTLASAAMVFYNRTVAAGITPAAEAAVANTALARSQQAVAAASAEATGSRGIGAFFRGLAATKGGSIAGLTAALGAAGLAGGIAFLIRRGDDWSASVRGLGAALDDLVGAVHRTHDSLLNLSQSKVDVALARDAEAAARLAVKQAEVAERSARGHKEHAEAALRLRTAQDQLKSATLEVTRAQDRQKDATQTAKSALSEQAATNESVVHRSVGLARQQSQAVSDRARQLKQLVDLQTAAGNKDAVAAAKAAVQPGIDRARASAVREFASAISKEAAAHAKDAPLLAGRLQKLADLAQASGRLPSKVEVRILLSTDKARRNLQDLISQIHGDAPLAQASAQALGESLVGGVVSGINASAGRISAAMAAAAQAGVKGGSTAVRARSPSGETHDKIGVPMIQGILVALGEGDPEIRDRFSKLLTDAVSAGADAAATGVTAAQARLREVIRTGRQNVRDTITQAKQNLNSLGQGLASLVDQFIDERARISEKKAKTAEDAAAKRQAERQAKRETDAAKKTNEISLKGPLARQFEALKRRIASGDTSPLLARQAQGLAAQLEAKAAVQEREAARKAAADAAKKKTTTDTGTPLSQQIADRAERRKTLFGRNLADLTDELNKGQITIVQFNARVARLLARQGINYKAAGRLLGTAFADEFAGALGGVRGQARAILRGPTAPGTGFRPQIVKPADALAQAVQETASAQAEVGRAIRDAAKEAAAAAKRQQAAAERTAKASEKTAASSAATAKATGFIAGLDRKGDGGKASRDTVGSTAP